MDFMNVLGILIIGLEYNLEEYISKDLNIIMEKNIVIVEDFNNQTHTADAPIIKANQQRLENQ